jgi:pimeloyl-ACP methyl ester carboxylesterase
VRVNEGASTPVLFVPGFGEGIINKAPFAAALASRGFDVILPGQNRTGILRDAANKRQPTMSQARNYEAILRAEKLDGVTVNLVSHSYGSLVLEALVKRMMNNSPDYFKDSQAIMLAPAGVGQESSIFELGKRWLRMLKSEMDKSTQDFPDIEGETGKASAKTLAANVPRMFGEVGDMLKKRVDFSELCRAVGEVTILSYKDDRIFPESFMASGAATAVNAGATWATPISLAVQPDGSIRGGEGATHDDEQFNPSRVAGAVAQILRVV